MRLLVFLPHDVPVFSATEAQVSRLSTALPGAEVICCRDPAAFFSHLPAATAAVVWRFNAEWYARAPLLRHVFTPAAGKELIAEDPAGQVRLHFGRFHGALMAESLLAMMLFMNRRLGTAIARQQARVWDRAAYASTRRLRGQTALLVGYGAIGEHCGALLRAVGMRVLGVRRDVSRGGAHAERVYGPDELPSAVEDADHIACVLPGDESTDRLIDDRVLARMRPTACLYNLGRGNAIDVEALVRALGERRLAGAFLDVVPEEPLPSDSALWTTPNLFLTPHASAISAEYLDLFFEDLAGELASL